MSEFDLLEADYLADEETAMFERSVLGFLDEHVTPEATERWRENGQVERSIWHAAGRAGLLGVAAPEKYGGGGGDFRHDAIIVKEFSHRSADAFSIMLHNTVFIPYFVSFATEAQKKRWLPKLCSGELVSAIAMTEPGTGSDLQAVKTTAKRTDGGYLLSGQKTFISNGQLAELILVVAKTDPSAGSKGISLLVVETENATSDQFRRGRNLSKLGQEGQDTSELFFDDLFVPSDCLLGEAEGEGFSQLMSKLPQERLSIAWQSIGMLERALAETIAYVNDREVFGQRLLDFQNTQFKLAEFKTQGTVARVFVDHCTQLLIEDKLDASTASMAKYWVSEQACEIIDGCLQLFGGYGYMLEYPIAHLYRDVRINRIYGGTTEIMKLLIARSL